MSDNPLIDGTVRIAEKIYDDALSPALREASKIGVDAAKVFRLALFPLQYGAMLQDRLDRYLKRAIDQVPEERRIAPVESIALTIAEQLKFQDEGNSISDLYVNLLSRAMDKDRVDEAHPAFIFIISQLAPIEIKIFNAFANVEFKVIFRDAEYRSLAIWDEVEFFLKRECSQSDKEQFLKYMYNYDEIGNEHLFLTFIEHLSNLGLLAYSGSLPEHDRWLSTISKTITTYPVQATAFGKLFYKACTYK